MRQITEQAVRAFEQGRNFKQSNTEVKVDNTGKYMYLFGNLIVRQYNGAQNSLEITLCGYNTQTTRERLNGLWGVNIKTKKGQLYLNDKEINSNEWYKVGLRLGD